MAQYRRYHSSLSQRQSTFIEKQFVSCPSEGDKLTTRWEEEKRLTRYNGMIEKVHKIATILTTIIIGDDLTHTCRLVCTPN